MKNKGLKVLTTSALLASVAAPFAAGVASAATDNRVDVVKSNSSSETTLSTGKLILKEDSDYLNDLQSGKTFTVTLPDGITFKKDNNDNVSVSTSDVVKVFDDKNLVAADVKFIGDRTMDVTLPTLAADKQTAVEINLDKNIVNDDFDGGNVEVSITGTESGVTTGKYTVATVDAGKTTTTVLSTPTIGDTGTAGVIRIAENSKGAIKDGSEIEVKLNSGFEWDGDPAIEGTAGLQGADIDITEREGRTLKFVVNKGTAKGDQPGTIQITPKVKTEDTDTKYGDIVASVSGDDITDADVVIAKYADYGVTVKADGDVKEVFSGRFETELTELEVEESLKTSILEGRKTTVELPSWVKVTNVEPKDQKNVKVTPSWKGDSNKFDFTVTKTGSGTASFKLKLEVSIEGGKEGDIVAKLSGKAGIEGEATIGKAIAPVKITASEPKGLKIGLKDQPIADLTITEVKKEAIQDESSADELRVKLSDGLEWSDTPKVEVTDGDLDIDEKNLDTDGEYLIIPIKSSSTKPSTIKITGAKVDVNRTVPEGEITASVRGNAVVENYKVGTLDGGEFDTASAASVKVADVITPAPGETTGYNVVFKLNSKTYTVNGKETEMDAAPLVGWDRAYLPVRFAANALNVSDDNIIWDDKTSTFTIFKGDRVITGKVGDKFLTVNGVKVPMDVPVWRNKEKTNNRVMVPIRYLSNALGATIDWNKETGEITVGVK